MSATPPVVVEVLSGPVTREEFSRIERKLDAALAELRKAKSTADKHVLSTSEAMEFVNCNSRTALCKWVNLYAPFARVKPNRYSRSRLEIGRARELNGVKEPTK